MVLLAGVFPVATLVLAAAADDAVLPPGALVRYFDDQGRVVITSTLPREAIDKGYELIDSRGRLLRAVEPPLPEAERRKMQEQQRARAENQELMRLYPTPADAERALDRQITTLQLQIDYARSAIVQLDDKLAVEMEAAALAEQAGRQVPEAVTGNIEVYTKQIREQEEKIARAEQDIVAAREQFAPIIERLRGIRDARPGHGEANGSSDEKTSTAEQADSKQ